MIHNTTLDDLAPVIRHAYAVATGNHLQGDGGHRTLGITGLGGAGVYLAERAVLHDSVWPSLVDILGTDHVHVFLKAARVRRVAPGKGHPLHIDPFVTKDRLQANIWITLNHGPIPGLMVSHKYFDNPEDVINFARGIRSVPMTWTEDILRQIDEASFSIYKTYPQTALIFNSGRYPHRSWDFPSSSKDRVSVDIRVTPSDQLTEQFDYPSAGQYTLTEMDRKATFHLPTTTN